jgi:ATP-dependent DNA ligase
LPDGERWLFEPKWDGFRALIFRDADDLFIQSRDEKPLGRYYPELIEPLRYLRPYRPSDIDGHPWKDWALDELRLHPAESRVRLLAKAMPASVIFFDILCEGDRDLRSAPFEERRAILARLLARAQPPLHLTPSTHNRTVAADWFRRFEGAGLDGVMAKHAIGVYESNKRTGFSGSMTARETLVGRVGNDDERHPRARFHAESETRARMRLRRRRLPLAQGR